MDTMTAAKPILLQVENSAEGRTYRTIKGVFKDGQHELIVWRKTTDKEVFVFIPAIDSLAPLPHGYVIEESLNQVKLDLNFNRDMLLKFQADFSDRRVIWKESATVLPAKSQAPIVSKETPKMTDTAPAAPKKKDVRAGYNAEILKFKQDREALSAKNVELKTQAGTLKTRAERKPLNAQIKANVDARAVLSESIKATLLKIQALRKDAPAA